MRFLLLTTSHGLFSHDQVMTNELVRALQDRGHVVDVLLLDWAGKARGEPRIVRGPHAEDILLVPAVMANRLGMLARRLVKWSATPLRASRAYNKHLSSRAYDGVIAGTPATLFEPVLRNALKGRDRTGILVIHDFFPLHHNEIGLVPNFASRMLKSIEERAMARFDVIYCNLPSNIGYLRRNYRVRDDQLVSWTPLWTRVEPIEHVDRHDLRRRYGLPPDQAIAVFGGQLIEGRGIELMLDAAKLAERKNPELLFLFIGNGRLSSLVQERTTAPRANVRWIAHVPRDEYLGLVSACDVGMVATVPGVSSHSFPTKTMDYLRVGIPAVVAVEPDSSFAEMITEAGVGLSVPFGDPAAFLAALNAAVGDEAFRAEVVASARRFLDDVLDVDLVPDKIVRDMAHVADTKTRMLAG